MNGIPKRWAIYFFALALLIALSTCYAADQVYKAVMCSTDWVSIVAQRYDTRNARGWITARLWISRCSNSATITWH